MMNELDSFFLESPETGDAMDDNIAKFTNKAIRVKADENQLKEIRQKHKRPENIEYLQVPKVDDFLWRQLRGGTRANDFLLQKTHSLLASAAVPLLKALKSAQTSKDKDLKCHLSDAFKLITDGIHSTIHVRRDKIKRDLQPKYKQLVCTLTPSAENLFDKLPESLKSLDSTKLTNITLTNQTETRRPFLGPRHQRWQQKRQPRKPQDRKFPVPTRPKFANRQHRKI